jgi:hypothetical protein
MTAKLDGALYLTGVQSITLGDGLEVGKQVNQAGQLGPMGFTKPLFKGDGNFSLKILAAGGTLMEAYLLGKGGIVQPEGIYSVKSSLKVTLNLEDDLFEIEVQNVQFLPPTYTGLDSPDSREPLTAEYKFTCTNRLRNDVPDWNASI